MRTRRAPRIDIGKLAHRHVHVHKAKRRFRLQLQKLVAQNYYTNSELLQACFGCANVCAAISNFQLLDEAYNPLSGLLNARMSIASNYYTTFMQIMDVYDFGAGKTVSVSHDDGASFYLINGTSPGRHTIIPF